ncbi:MAG: hypothetical protein ACRDOM_06360 [Nocardioides sp.]
MQLIDAGILTCALVLLTGCSAVQGAVGKPAVAGIEAGDLFVHGEVLRDGDPVAGAEVSLLIEDLGAVGESAAYDVPSVTTGKDGGYMFEIDPEELPARFVVDDSVTFEVAVADRGSRSAWSSTVWLVGDAAGWRGPGGELADAVPALSFDLGRGSVEVTDSAGESTTYGE